MEAILQFVVGHAWEIGLVVLIAAGPAAADGWHWLSHHLGA